MKDERKKRGPKPILGRPMTAAERKQRQLTKQRLLMIAAKERGYSVTTALISNQHIEALTRLEPYRDRPANERINLFIESAIIRLLDEPIAPTPDLELIYEEARQAFAKYQERQKISM